MSHVSTEFAGQQDRILEVFKSNGYWQWVGRLGFPPTILDFTTRIWELRWKRDLNIQSERLPNKNGKAIWRYRLLPGSWRELRGKPETDRPSSARQERVDWFEKEFGKPRPSTTSTTQTIDLPLFDGVKQ